MIDDRIELCCCSSVLLAIRSVAEREREREGLDSGSERGIVVYNGMFFFEFVQPTVEFREFPEMPLYSFINLQWFHYSNI